MDSKKYIRKSRTLRIAQIVQELGFYDGDINQLPAIDYETGSVDNSKNYWKKLIQVLTNTKKKPKITKKKRRLKKKLMMII